MKTPCICLLATALAHLCGNADANLRGITSLRDVKRPGKKNKVVNTIVESACPESNGICFYISDPVSCGYQSCPYENVCYAMLAGFDIAKDCRRVDTEGDSCPEPSTGTADRCDDDTSDKISVTCGPRDCPYEDSCLATSAGFNVDEDCQSVHTFQEYGDSENGNSCPKGDTTECEENIKKDFSFACGPNNCPYESKCLYETAGFEKKDCKKVFECPEVHQNACDADIKGPTVACGKENCLYQSKCFAQAAGYNVNKECEEIEQEEECPTGDDYCDYVHPLVCGAADCRYNNDCHAESAGYIVDVDCTPVCPEGGDSCGGDSMNRLLCGPEKCLYNNECHASFAEFDVDKECVPADPQDDCPSGDDANCFDEWNPLACGDQNCWYQNECYASAAGFVEIHSDCEILDGQSRASCPDGDSANCVDEWNPLACGDQNCWYQNECYASAAGFETHSDCEILDGQSRASCPDGDNANCVDEWNPLACGDQSCWYQNECYASAAGFETHSDCEILDGESNASCPDVTEHQFECTDFLGQPVTCGSMDCPYDNECLAIVAGFDVVEECDTALDTKTTCPPIQGVCIGRWDPVVCGPRSCPYTNKCWAISAGYEPEDDCVEVDEGVRRKLSMLLPI